MNSERGHHALSILSGEARGLGPSLIRGGLRAIEPVYAGIMRARNLLYDRRILRAQALGRYTISVGNLTTGGTGKTPVVQWLAEQLRAQGHRPAILLRGYAKADASQSDEEAMLDELLNRAPGIRPVLIAANPNRVKAATDLLRAHPEIDTFILDDGFQHRRAARDFDLVLINAADPWGFGHVLPRGLLREPIRGLRRANAALITHADQVAPPRLAEIEQTVRCHAAHVPIYHATHVLTGVRLPDGSLRPLDALGEQPYLAFAGIGDPHSLQEQLNHLSHPPVQFVAFGDHHDYISDDLTGLIHQAEERGAHVLVTTAKDWSKIRRLLPQRAPIWRLDMLVGFCGDHDTKLLDQLRHTP